MNNYFLIHGSYGSPYKNWMPWLKQELSVRKLECLVPNFPTPPNQNYECWSTILKAYLDIGLITEHTTFITHSLGGVFLTKFLLQYHLKVKQIIYVAAFNNITFDKDNDIYNTFYVENLKEIKKYCSDITCIYSDDDPYISKEKAEEFADSIAAKKVLILEAGHFTGKYGYREFKELLKYI